MQDGFDAVIAQGGTNVYGGQKQRLSIARALVRRPEIYLFDDSFSALDFKTDARLRAALKKETRESTVFIVSQRVSTVMDADQIIVLEDGCIADIGTHRELMKTCEVYRDIVSSQLSTEEIAEEIA
jgi:ATP-binding cassette subfamily B protein